MTPVLGNILQPLIDFFHWFLLTFHQDLGLGWGTSIIALTLLVRGVLLPVTYKSSKSMIRLQQLAPQMKSMQKKYKEDPQRLQQETMKFYRENSVNPFASCLPMVAQLPVFLSLYYMLRVDLRHDICPTINPIKGVNPLACGSTGDSGFLFIPDLTGKATGWVLVVLIILYVGSQLVSTLLMSATADKNQRMIFLALPFLFVAFIWQFPAGLLVYWITTNLWTILQQSIIKKRLGPLREEAAAAAKAHKEQMELEEAKGKGKGKSGKSGGGKGGGRALGKLSPTAATADGGGGGGGGAKARGANGPPPSPPRKKKKRSGRRR
ncbi:MAG: YidC/Oxa1 family membrane protein insertase [Solirubrobacteraceae bacterium]